MKNRRQFNLNLASHPLRNRRLFYFLAGSLGLASLILSAAGGGMYLHYQAKGEELRSALKESEQMTDEARRKEGQFALQIEKAEKENWGRVDFVNSLIFRKSFSWLEFLEDLEAALPPSCFVTSLSPSLLGGSAMEVKFTVAYTGLDELLKLIDSLNSLKFKKINIRSETRSSSGEYLAEISVNYERTL